VSPGERALVTGGGGFLGKAIVRELLEDGFNVSSFSRGSYPELEGMGVLSHRGDLGDAAAVSEAVEGNDVVFHTASRVGFWGRYEDFHRTNVEGTGNVIDACRNHRVRYLVYTSSPSVVFGGRDIEGADESIPYPKEHGSHYNRTKAIAERMVLGANGKDLMTLSLRPHLVWGPGDDRLVPRITDAARRGRLRVVGHGRNTVDMVYVDNAARAHLLAYEALRNNPACRGKAYFITNGEPVNTWEAIDRFLDIQGLPPLKGGVPKWAAMVLASIVEAVHTIAGKEGEPMVTRFLIEELTTSHWFDISAAGRDLGYVPHVTMEEGMKAYSRYLKESMGPA